MPDKPNAGDGKQPRLIRDVRDYRLNAGETVS